MELSFLLEASPKLTHTLIFFPGEKFSDLNSLGRLGQMSAWLWIDSQDHAKQTEELDTEEEGKQIDENLESGGEGSQAEAGLCSARVLKLQTC